MKRGRHASIVLGLVAASLVVMSSHVAAERTVEEASTVLLDESLAVLGVNVTDPDLRASLAFELQYALSEGIVDSDTIVDLELGAMSDELPDEDLFGDDNEETTTTSSPDAGGTDLTDQVRTRLRERFARRLALQTRYWEVVAPDWARAAEQSRMQLEACLDAAADDEQTDLCYFNELSQFQIAFSAELTTNLAQRRTAAVALGADVAGLLDASLIRLQSMLRETLEFMSEEELAELGTTRSRLEELEGLTRVGGSGDRAETPVTTPGTTPGPAGTSPRTTSGGMR